MKYGPGSAVTESCHLVMTDDDYVLDCDNLISNFLSKGYLFLEPQAEIFLTQRIWKLANAADFLNSSRSVMGKSSELKAVKEWSVPGRGALCDNRALGWERTLRGCSLDPWLYKCERTGLNSFPEAVESALDAGAWSLEPVWSSQAMPTFLGASNFVRRQDHMNSQDHPRSYTLKW